MAEERKPLIFEELSVRWGPANRERKLRFEQLSRSVNIIKGPNASGKSTTARAVRHLIWNEDSPVYINRSAISATANTDNQRWIFTWNYGSGSIQREGNTVNRAALNAGTRPDRYDLSLHNLLLDKDTEMAQQIYKEMLGGYDIEEARKALGFSDAIKSKSINEYRDLNAAIKKEQELQQMFAKLADEEEELEKLRQKAKMFAPKKQRGKLIEELIGFAEIKQQKQRIEKLLERFNSSVPFEKMIGNEWEELQRYKKEQSDKRDEIEELEQEIKSLEKRQRDLNLPQSKPDRSVVRQWQSRSDKWAEKLKEIKEEEKRAKQIKEKLTTLCNFTDEEITPANWQEPESQEWGNLEEILIDILAEKSRLRELEQQKETVSEQIEDLKFLPSEELLNEVIIALKELGLQSEQKDTETTLPLKTALLIFLVAGILGTVGFFVYWAVSLVVFVLALLILFRVARKYDRNTQSDTTSHWIQVINRADFITLERRNADEIKKALDLVIEKKQLHYHKQQLQSTLERIRGSIQTAKNQLQNKEKEVEKLEKKFGKLPEFQSAARFFIFLHDWHDIHALLSSLGGSLRKILDLTKEASELTSALYTDIQQTIPGIKISGDLNRLKEWLEQLETNLETWYNLAHDKDKLAVTKGHLESTLQNINADIQKIREKFPPRTEEEEIREWCQQLSDFNKLKNDLNQKEIETELKKREIEEHSHLQKGDLQKERTELEQEKSEIDKFLDQESFVSEKIRTIENKLYRARENRELQEAYQQTQEAWFALKARRDENLKNVTGHLVCQLLQEQTRLKQSLPVLERANSWFTRFTNGSYGLQVEPSSEESRSPEFRAVETDTENHLELDKLSSGTRIQLLLAVRLAYVEHHEGNIKLPLLIDELLANSDDQRARQIIDALIDIAESGRQIFYFTAQSDEVLKWRTINDNTSVDIREFSLTDDSTVSTVPFSGPKEMALPNIVTSVPEPDNKTHHEYGHKIDVPIFNPLTNRIQDLHLWYIIESPQQLYQLLSRGITSWGHLQTLIQTDTPLPLTKQERHRLEAATSVINRYLQLIQKGQPRPVNEAVLKDSGAVTENFWDEVVRKMNELDKNPQQLLNALKNGEISRFRNDKTEQLETYLYEQGYLSTEVPLSQEELQQKLNKFILEHADHNRPFIQRVLDRIEERFS